MNADMLKGKIREYGMTQDVVAQRLGLSLSRFNAKLNSTKGAEFSLGEVQGLKELFKLEAQQVDEIFFS